MTSKAFLAGALASASLILFTEYFLGQRHTTRKRPQNDKKSSRGEPTKAPPTRSDNDIHHEANHPLMDSPLLDQRMIRKAEGAILKRTSRITIVVERCTNDHNYSAILRTAEALGVQNVWIISPPIVNSEGEEHISKTGQYVKSTEAELKERQMHHLFARKATEWLTVREFHSTIECITALRDTNHTIWATDLSQQAVCLTKEALSFGEHSGNHADLIPAKLAIVFGTEAVGCTEELLQASDLRVYLPLRGFADSLNLSVAAALVIHQLFTLDPAIEGDMSENERTQLRYLWFTKLASQRLLTQSQKKHRGRLEAKIAVCQNAQAKLAAGKLLQKEEVEKMALLEQHHAELAAIDLDVMTKARLAVSDLVQCPPAPITDMRRADPHRTCYVGKKTKTKYDGIWDGMAATTNYQTEKGSSSRYFRQRAGITGDVAPSDRTMESNSEKQ